MKSTFSIIHPSARPDKWAEIYNAWMNAADNPGQVEYILACDPTWGFDRNNIYPELSWSDERRPYVKAVNDAASLSSGQILIVIADDQYPAPHWDTAILNFMDSMEIPVSSEQFVIRARTNTPNEIERGITVMPIMSRGRYNHLGYIFYPEYESMYADNDLTGHSMHDGCFYDAKDRLPIFPHRHPINTPGMATDEAYQTQNRPEAYTKGELLLRARVLNGFKQVTQEQLNAIPPANIRKTIAVCLPGEIFSSTWVSAWTGLFVNLFTKFNIIPIFCHTSNVHVTRGVLAAQVIQQLQTAVKPDYVLWIDDDNPTHWEHVVQLIADLEHVPEADMVVGWCWIWNELGKNFIASCGHLKEEDNTCLNFTDEVFRESSYDLIEVGFSGFPLVLMRIQTLVKITEEYKHPFAPMIDPNHPWGAMSEDTAFCRRMSDMGMKIFVDRRVRVDHLKTVTYGPETRYGLSSPTILPAAENSNPVLVEKK